MTHTSDRAIASIAAKQNGNIGYRQLRALGLIRSAIQYRVKTGRLYRVHQGVYSVGRPPSTPVEWASASVLAGGPGAALGHASAAAHWGFRRSWPRQPEVMVRQDRRPGGIRTHRVALARRDVRTHLGIRVTSPARTLLDIAPSLSDAELKRAVNNARLQFPYVKLSEIADVIDRNPRHQGARRLRWFVAGDAHNPTRSGLEDVFVPFCARFGLPTPLINVAVAGYEVDALFAEHRVIVELDGFDVHSGRHAFESDRERDATTLAAGYPTIRITRARMDGAPEKEASRLREILAARGHRAA